MILYDATPEYLIATASGYHPSIVTPSDDQN
jgi:hypothetical protein